MQPVIIRAVRSRLLTVLAVSLAFTALAVLLLAFGHNQTEHLYGWVLLGIQAFLIPRVAREISDSSPRIVIDDLGFDDRKIGVGRIPWSAVVGVKLNTRGSSNSIDLDLANPETWRLRIPLLRRWRATLGRLRGHSEFSLDLSFTDVSSHDVLILILRHRQQFHSSVSPKSARPSVAPSPVATIESLERESAELRSFHSLLAAGDNRTLATKSLIAANIFVFIAAVMAGAAVMAPDGEFLVRLGSNYGPLTLGGQPWRLLSSVFLHFGLLHLGLNMWALYNGGQLAERLYGSQSFLIIYFTAGICGSIASIGWNPEVNSAGASGAIFGVFGAMLAYFLRKDATIPASVVRQQRASGLTFIGYNLLFGFSSQGIDNAAHIGGLLSGMVTGLLVARPLGSNGPYRTMIQLRLRAIAAGAVVAGGLWYGASHPNDFALRKRQFHSDIIWIAKIDRETQTAFGELVGRLHSETIGATEFADQLERDTISEWKDANDRLAHDQPLRSADDQELWNAYKGLASSREKAYLLYVAIARSGDHPDYEPGNEAMKEAGSYVDQINELSRQR